MSNNKMDIKEHILVRKRIFEEEVRVYQGPDPLKLRCDFLQALESYDKELIHDIYSSVLEDTLRSFMEEAVYKQDLRFIHLWLAYSHTQPNPVVIYENMFSRGLGTECTILYASWAEHLLKNGQVSNADKIFKMGLSNDVKPKSDLQKAYDEFLKEVGKRYLLGELSNCPTCGKSEGNSTNTPKVDSSDVEVWEWNPLKVGEKDDFTCPLAYFEDPDPTKIRMYPKDKVYPGSGQEFSIEEVMAEVYEKRYEEEEKQKKIAEMKIKEDEARRARDEQRRIEAEKMKFDTMTELNPPVQASIPIITPKMFNVPKDIDVSLANGSTFTVHTKEAMNVVQDMWSSPAPSEAPPRHLYQTNMPEEISDVASKPQSQFQIFSDAEEQQPAPKQHFQIYDENSENNVPSNNQPLKPKIPFDIYCENEPPTKLAAAQSVKQSSALKPKLPFEVYDENNTQSHKTPLSHNRISKPDPNSVAKNENAHDERNGRLRYKLFADDGGDELAEKMETQAKLQPMFPVQKHDDFEDVTCNTKAFEFVLPSSTPFSNHKKPILGTQKTNSEDLLKKTPQANANLSMILEQSKERYSCSSTDSSSSQAPKTPKSGPVISAVPEDFDPFNAEVLESLLNKVGFPKHQYANNLFIKTSNVPNFSKNIKLGEDAYSVQGEIGKGAYARVVKASKGNNTVALKVEKPACKWEFYIAKEIQGRVPPKLAILFMDIPEAHIYNNGSILVTQWAKHGNLLNIVNTFKEKTGRSLERGVVFHFGVELIDIVDYLHRAKIIHADLKPDNIVIRELPDHNETEPCLQLIDFGRCIDMSLLPPETKFNCVFKTEDNQCNEMKENKPWTYQIDLYGLANIFHCLLLSEYMQVVKKNDKWMLQKQIPRNMRREVWNPIFDTLLNVNPETDLPMDFSSMKALLIEAFNSTLHPSIQSLITFKNYITNK
ncbi:mitotic checkpoint serine/threonine-protein kinase BUB1 [Halyomorpha halys]|uniref:mitotic checkpoint serine/threonine-protein kinase BUB1 n=1 Tax=Halyomorpha halys TaxID=286706 RepID=UPI0006D5211A|nr:mitotic checkpoint serine/threonine-protein kinase BUB1-like [Halyomorpha halys]